jgi:hypothetical protein
VVTRNGSGDTGANTPLTARGVSTVPVRVERLRGRRNNESPWLCAMNRDGLSASRQGKRIATGVRVEK